ncbi:unnamed protein product [Angiostrongylus costaricensis]|uniref:BBS2_C domain-containing protein n=1 Tax=Angiostrongylus costaricensis TaxID=334426 RepID=A0A158PE45_ANGCS|nr:unnamed protein product [Angiostrongylus costaricensis]
MRTSVSELRRSLEGKPYLISSFRYKNLVIFCDGSLIFVYGFVNNNGVAEYTKSVKVILSPPIPTDVRISFMSAIHDGSLVVFSSVNSLFIVRVSADLWASKADGHVPLGQYFCGLQVHDSQLTSYGASEITEGIGLPLNEKVLDTILSNKKNLLPIKVASSQHELLKNLFDFFDTANRNQVVIRAALEMSRDRLTALIKFANELADKQNVINHRLLQVFRHTVAVKEKMETIRPSVLKTFVRIDKISTQLTDSQELTADETKLLDVLKEYRSKMFTNAMKTSKLSLEAAQLQREIRGPARAFTASPGAKLFVLQNSEEELSTLKRRLDNISAKLEQYGLRRTVENKENLQS